MNKQLINTFINIIINLLLYACLILCIEYHSKLFMLFCCYLALSETVLEYFPILSKLILKDSFFLSKHLERQTFS